MAANEESVERSIEERIAAKFDVPKSDELEQSLPDPSEQPVEESEEPKETPDPLYEVEFEGKTYRLPGELKDALMAKADYTTKTQQLARNRESLELRQAQVNAFVENQRFEQTLQNELSDVAGLNFQISQAKKIDWDKLDSAQLIKARTQLDQLKERRDELQRSITSKRETFAKQQQAAMQDHIAKAGELLAKAIPGWGDALAQNISEYALSKGYTKHEVEHIVNPRDVEVLFKAMQYDKLKESKDASLQKASKAPPVIKPGAVKPMPQDVRDKLAFKKAMDKSKSNNAPPGERARLIQQRLEQKMKRLS